MPPEEGNSAQPIARSRDMSALYTPIAIVVAGLLVGAAIFFGLSGKSGSGRAGTSAGAPSAQRVDVKDVKVAGQPFIGSPGAKLVMAAWEDYQCPFCRQFETTVLPSLVEKYVATGKLRIVFKDYEFLGPDSTADGEYARAVWELYPKEYFAWRKAMFDAQPQENSLSAAENQSHLEKVTASVPGIDAPRVKSAVAANKARYDQAMAADQQEGSSFGIQGTPGFIVGTQSIDGAQPLNVFESAINVQLK